MLLLVAIGAIAWRRSTGCSAPEAGGHAASCSGWPASACGQRRHGADVHARPAQDDLNVRGAFLHMAADAGVSAGVVAAALRDRLTGWLWLDPAVSLAIAR